MSAMEDIFMWRICEVRKISKLNRFLTFNSLKRKHPNDSSMRIYEKQTETLTNINKRAVYLYFVMTWKKLFLMRNEEFKHIKKYFLLFWEIRCFKIARTCLGILIIWGNCNSMMWKSLILDNKLNDFFQMVINQKLCKN